MAAYLFDAMYTRLQGVLDLRNQQHALTATNLANVETPGYRARVIDFENALGAVVKGTTVDASGQPVVPSADNNPAWVSELEAPPWAVDGNSVVLEREVSRLKEGFEHACLLAK